MTGEKRRSPRLAGGKLARSAAVSSCLLALILHSVFSAAVAVGMSGQGSMAAADSRSTDGGRYEGYVIRETTLRNRYEQDLRVRLAFPASDGLRAAGRFPVILMYTTYCREPDSEFDIPGAPDLLRSGYAIAAVYQPGMCGSEGHTEVYPLSVAESGYDAVEWLARQPWSTGKVGMIGYSSPGIAAWFTAETRPPHLTTIITTAASTDFYEDLMYRGGMPWSTDSAALNPWILAAFYADNQLQRARDPEDVRETVRNGWYRPPTFAVDTYTHPLKDAFWQKWVVDLDRIDIPLLTMGSWDDYFPSGTLAQFQDTASRDKMLVMGFSGHRWPGPDFDYTTLVQRWFDHYLKGRHNGIGRQVKTDPVQYYVRREYQWRTAGDIPVPGTRFQRFGLRHGTDLPGATGSLVPGAGDAGKATYVYQPTQGRHNGVNDGGFFAEPNSPNRPESDDLVSNNSPTYSGDQRLESADSLTYVTAPLKRDVEITGKPTITLDAASTADDTDWVVKLIDIFPSRPPSTSGPQSGYWEKATQCQLKGTHRFGHRRAVPIPVNEKVRYTITCLPTSQVFEAGHRIGVMISSAAAADRVPNPNPAINTVYHSTRVAVPIVPRRAGTSDR